MHADQQSWSHFCYLIFAADADLDGGTISLESDGDATYNPSTGTISATNFSGNLTGTLQTAAQPNVTSLGTLSSIDIDGGAIDGAAIGANSASTGAFTTITASTSLDVTGSTGIILENDETIQRNHRYLYNILFTTNLNI